MGKNYLHSIPEKDISFEPHVVKRDIEALERIERKGKLSYAGYAELALLKGYEEFQKEKSKEKDDASSS